MKLSSTFQAIQDIKKAQKTMTEKEQKQFFIKLEKRLKRIAD